MTYRLSLRAQDDIRNLYRSGIERFGVAQADRYFNDLHEALEMLAAFPGAGPQRRLTSPPVRVYPFGAHVIVYLAAPPGVQILRVRHGREDWTSSPLGD